MQNFYPLLGLAFGLSMDAFAVSACKGMMAERVGWRQALTVGLWFGGFQAAMPAFGYLLGNLFCRRLLVLHRFFAFFLLLLLGIHMIWDACLHQSGKEGLDGSFSFPVLAVLAIATSMDALVAGFTLPSTVGMRLFPSVAVIGIVTAALCTGGVKVGFLFGDRVGRPAKILGGLILLLLSCKIFMEQMR